MNDFIINLLAVLLSTSSLVALIVWAIKTTVNKLLQANNERLKIELQLEHQKYTNLQTEQFTTMKTLFANLVRIDDLLKEVYERQSREVKFDKPFIDGIYSPLIALVYETDQYFKQNSIFFNQGLCDIISKSMDAIFTCLSNSANAIVTKSEDVMDKQGNNKGIQERKLDELPPQDKESYESLIKSIDLIRKNELRSSIDSIQAEFRILFGVK